MIPVLRKLSGLYSWYILVVLTLGYLTAELGHFLIGVTSKSTSRDVPYGDVACMLKENILEENFNLTMQFACESALNQSSCEALTYEDGEQYCEWDRNGLGIEYQILAGPSFIAVYTILGVALGIAADKYKRVPMLAIAVLVCGVSVFLIGAAKEYWQLIVLRMVFAAGEAALNPMSTGVLSDIFPENLRALVMSIFNWGIYGGIGFSFPVGRYISKWNFWNLGWRVAYYGSGAFAIIIGILTATTLREPERTAIGEEKEEGNSSSPQKTNNAGSEKKQESPWKVLLSPRFVMLCLAASIRHTGGLCFAYNCDQFYRVVFPHLDLSGWLFFVTCIVGGLGVLVGGYASDKLVAGMGIRSRVLFLAASQLIATPFAFGSIYMGPVGSMVTLAISYLFAEMWFGILFAVLVEIVPLAVRSAAIGVFLFVMNNVGGNLPILVEPIRKATSFADALAIFYAGAYLISSILFGITAFMMKPPPPTNTDTERNMSGVDNAAYANTEQVQNKVTESHYL